MMAKGLGNSSLNKMRAESLLDVSERLWDEKTLPKKLKRSAIQVNFWLIQTLQGFFACFILNEVFYC